MREYAGEYDGDAELDMQKAGAEPRQYTCDHCNDQRQPGGPACDNQHNRHGGAEGERAVHGEVGDVQQPEGDQDSEGHQTPYETLGNTAGNIFNQLQKAQ